MKLNTVFNVIQGHQITDEELYRTDGNIPVYTGRNEIKGYWNKSIITEEDLPCLTYPTKAFSGEIYIQKKIFDANNTAILIPLDDWRKKLNLNWVSRIIGSEFLKVATSKEGVSYLNKEIVNEIEIEIPDKDIQDKQYSKLAIFEEYHKKVNKILEKMDSLKSSALVDEYKQYQARGIPIKDVLDCMSGNSGLTEKFIYQKSQHKNKKYNVLASSEEHKFIGILPPCEIDGKPLRYFENKDGLLVIRKGKAGLTRFLDKGSYTINEDAYILFVKDDCKYTIDLNWLSIQYKQEFLQYSSSSDNGTWNKTGFFENVKVDIPNKKEQLAVVRAYQKIGHYESVLRKIYAKIQGIFSKTLVKNV